jgi:predicted ArsR family transcriptional regulator
VPDPESQLAALGILAEPVRRSLYLYVSRQPDDVGREQAARALSITRSLAAFHLDKLVQAGLLEAGYRRLRGRGGPGAGRPSKVYRRSGPDVLVTIPARDYELAARLAVTAIEQGGTPEALRATARRHGAALGSRARGSGRRRDDRTLMRILSEAGFDPSRSGTEIRLNNCPFRALAADHRDQICGMNLALLEGVVEGLGTPGLRAEADRTPGRCCVTFRPATRAPAG